MCEISGDDSSRMTKVTYDKVIEYLLERDVCIRNVAKWVKIGV